MEKKSYNNKENKNKKSKNRSNSETIFFRPNLGIILNSASYKISKSSFFFIGFRLVEHIHTILKRLKLAVMYELCICLHLRICCVYTKGKKQHKLYQTNTKRLKLYLLSLERESLVLLQLLDSVVVST